MSSQLKGAVHTSLDDKGRLSMPTRYRDAFAQCNNELTITRHPHGCLLIFTRPNWELFSKQIEVMPIDSQWMKRMFYGYAMDMELDKSGRVLVSPELRATAQVQAGSEILLLGMGRYVELWDRQLHAAKEGEAMQNEIPLGFKELPF